MQRSKSASAGLKPLGWDFDRPWASKSFWIASAIWAVWVLILAVGILSEFDLEAERTTQNLDRSLWGLIVLSTVLLIIRFFMIARFPNQIGTTTANDLVFEVWRQASAMIRYSLERGRTPNATDILVVENIGSDPSDEEVAALVRAHKDLSTLVAPAMPKTLALLYFQPDEQTGAVSSEEHSVQSQPFPWLGSVRLVRMMLALAMILVPLFIALALAVGTRLSSTEGLFTGDIVDKTQTGCYLIVAASLGASFAALFKARRYIENLSYDDQYESSYWMRFVLGLLAGLILAVILSILLPSSSNPNDVTNDAFQVTVPLLALVGGFSSDLVYRILKRVIEAIETLIEGSASEAADLQAQQSESRLKAQALESDANLHAQLLAGQQQEAAGLLQVLQSLPQDTSADEARDALRARLAELLASGPKSNP